MTSTNKDNGPILRWADSTFAYLYGKEIHLGQLYNSPRGTLRFNDTRIYSGHENSQIRDDELRRILLYPLETLNSINIGGQVIPAAHLTRAPKLGVPTRRCHILCLSKKAYDSQLFTHFSADICLRVNVTFLMGLMESSLLVGKGSEIVARDVTYVSSASEVPSITGLDLVFVKDARFANEAEYRIGVFYPYDEDTYIDDGVKKTHLFADDKVVLCTGNDYGLRFIVDEARDASGTVVFRKDHPQDLQLEPPLETSDG